MVVVRFLFTISIIDLHRLLRDGQERKELLLIYEDLYHLCSVDDCLMFYGWMDGWMAGQVTTAGGFAIVQNIGFVITFSSP